MTLKSCYLAAGAALILATASSGAHAFGAQDKANATLKGVFPFNETIIGVVAPATGGACPQTLAAGSINSQLMLTNQGT